MTTKPTHRQLATALLALRMAALARLEYSARALPADVALEWSDANIAAHALVTDNEQATDLPPPGDYETEVLAQFVAWLQAKMDEPRGRMAVLDLLDNDTVLAEYDTHLRPED